jgi:hypothetical protein
VKPIELRLRFIRGLMRKIECLISRKIR